MSRILLLDSFVNAIEDNVPLYALKYELGRLAYELDTFTTSLYESDDLSDLAWLPTEFDPINKKLRFTIRSESLEVNTNLYLSFSTDNSTWTLGAVLKLAEFNMKNYSDNKVTIDLSEFLINCEFINKRPVRAEGGENWSLFNKEHDHITKELSDLAYATDVDLTNVNDFIVNLRSSSKESLNENSLHQYKVGEVIFRSDGRLLLISSLGGSYTELTNFSGVASKVITDEFINNQLGLINLEELFHMGDFKIRLLGKNLPSVSDLTYSKLNALVLDLPNDPANRSLRQLNLPDNFHYYGRLVGGATTYNSLLLPGTYQLVGLNLSNGPVSGSVTGILEVNKTGTGGGIVYRQLLTLDSGETYTRAYNPTSGGNWRRVISNANVGEYREIDLLIKSQAEFNTMIASPTWLGAQSVALVGQFTHNNNITIPSNVKSINGFNDAKITITLTEGNAFTSNNSSIRDLSIEATFSKTTGNHAAVNGFTNVINCNAVANGASTGTIYGFYNCRNLINSAGTAKNTDIGTSKKGYGFGLCQYANSCKIGPTGNSTTATWEDTCTRIDGLTCQDWHVNSDTVGNLYPADLSRAKMNITVVTNLNTVIVTGTYEVKGVTNTNVPTGIGTYYILEVHQGASGNLIQQITTTRVGSVGTLMRFIRALDNTTWSSWVEIPIEGRTDNKEFDIISKSSMRSRVRVNVTNFNTFNPSDLGINTGDSVNFNSLDATNGPTWVTGSNSTAGIVTRISTNRYQVTIFNGEGEVAYRKWDNGVWGSWAYPMFSTAERAFSGPIITSLAGSDIVSNALLFSSSVSSQSGWFKLKLPRSWVDSRIIVDIIFSSGNQQVSQVILNAKMSATEWTEGSAYVSNVSLINAITLGHDGTDCAIAFSSSSAWNRLNVRVNITIMGESLGLWRTGYTGSFISADTILNSRRTVSINSGTSVESVTANVGGAPITELFNIADRSALNAKKVTTSADSSGEYPIAVVKDRDGTTGKSTITQRDVIKINLATGQLTALQFNADSAASKKDDIVEFDRVASDLINGTRIVSFTYKEDKSKTPKVGFIADDTDTLLSTPKQNSMDIPNCIGILMKALQEQSKEIAELKSKLR